MQLLHKMQKLFPYLLLVSNESQRQIAFAYGLNTPLEASTAALSIG